MSMNKNTDIFLRCLPTGNLSYLRQSWRITGHCVLSWMSDEQERKNRKDKMKEKTPSIRTTARLFLAGHPTKLWRSAWTGYLLCLCCVPLYVSLSLCVTQTQVVSLLLQSPE